MPREVHPPRVYDSPRPASEDTSRSFNTSFAPSLASSTSSAGTRKKPTKKSLVKSKLSTSTRPSALDSSLNLGASTFTLPSADYSSLLQTTPLAAPPLYSARISLSTLNFDSDDSPARTTGFAQPLTPPSSQDHDDRTPVGKAARRARDSGFAGSDEVGEEETYQVMLKKRPPVYQVQTVEANPSPPPSSNSIARRAFSPAPQSPLKSSLARSRKRATSTLNSPNKTAEAVPSPNPRARKQAKALNDHRFTFATPGAGPSRRPTVPRTDRPAKKATLSQSVRKAAALRRKSAPSMLPKGVRIMPTAMEPDMPPPPQSPGDDPLLLKGVEKVRVLPPSPGADAARARQEQLEIEEDDEMALETDSGDKVDETLKLADLDRSSQAGMDEDDYWGGGMDVMDGFGSDSEDDPDNTFYPLATAGHKELRLSDLAGLRPPAPLPAASTELRSRPSTPVLAPDVTSPKARFWSTTPAEEAPQPVVASPKPQVKSPLTSRSLASPSPSPRARSQSRTPKAAPLVLDKSMLSPVALQSPLQRSATPVYSPIVKSALSPAPDLMVESTTPSSRVRSPSGTPKAASLAPAARNSRSPTPSPDLPIKERTLVNSSIAHAEETSTPLAQKAPVVQASSPSPAADETLVTTTPADKPAFYESTTPTRTSTARIAFSPSPSAATDVDEDITMVSTPAVKAAPRRPATPYAKRASSPLDATEDTFVSTPAAKPAFYESATPKYMPAARQAATASPSASTVADEDEDTLMSTPAVKMIPRKSVTPARTPVVVRPAFSPVPSSSVEVEEGLASASTLAKVVIKESATHVHAPMGRFDIMPSHVASPQQVSGSTSQLSAFVPLIAPHRSPSPLVQVHPAFGTPHPSALVDMVPAFESAPLSRSPTTRPAPSPSPSPGPSTQLAEEPHSPPSHPLSSPLISPGPSTQLLDQAPYFFSPVQTRSSLSVAASETPSYHLDVAVDTPAPALSPYVFAPPRTPDSYSGSEPDEESQHRHSLVPDQDDDDDEDVGGEDARNDSILSEIDREWVTRDQSLDESGWNQRVRSSLTPDSTDGEQDQPEHADKMARGDREGRGEEEREEAREEQEYEEDLDRDGSGSDTSATRAPEEQDEDDSEGDSSFFGEIEQKSLLDEMEEDQDATDVLDVTAGAFDFQSDQLEEFRAFVNAADDPSDQTTSHQIVNEPPQPKAAPAVKPDSIEAVEEVGQNDARPPSSPAVTVLALKEDPVAPPPAPEEERSVVVDTPAEPPAPAVVESAPPSVQRSPTPEVVAEIALDPEDAKHDSEEDIQELSSERSVELNDIDEPPAVDQLMQESPPAPARRTPSIFPSPVQIYPSLPEVITKKRAIADAEPDQSRASSYVPEADRSTASASAGPWIKISSNDPRQAARATALLKLFHDYVETGTNPNVSIASSSRDRSFASRMSSLDASRRRSSTSHLGDLSMISVADDLLLEAEQEIAFEDDEAISDEEAMEEEEDLPIPGSYTRSNSDLSLVQITKGKHVVRKSTVDRPWGPAEWRSLMECLDASSANASAEEVIDGFLQRMDLREIELEGDWTWSKLHLRVASIQQRRVNERSRSASKRRRSYHPQKELLLPHKASTPAFTRKHSSTSPSTRRPIPSSASSSTLAGKVLNFINVWRREPSVVLSTDISEVRMSSLVRATFPRLSAPPTPQVIPPSSPIVTAPSRRTSQVTPPPDHRSATSHGIIPLRGLSFGSSAEFNVSSAPFPPRRQSVAPIPPLVTAPINIPSRRPRPSITNDLPLKPRSSFEMTPPNVSQLIKSFESARKS